MKTACPLGEKVRLPFFNRRRYESVPDLPRAGKPSTINRGMYLRLRASVQAAPYRACAPRALALRARTEGHNVEVNSNHPNLWLPGGTGRDFSWPSERRLQWDERQFRLSQSTDRYELFPCGHRKLLGSHHTVTRWKQESDQREKEETGSVDEIASPARPLRRDHVQKRHADVLVEWIRSRFHDTYSGAAVAAGLDPQGRSRQQWGTAGDDQVYSSRQKDGMREAGCLSLKCKFHMVHDPGAISMHLLNVDRQPTTSLQE